MCLAIHLSQTDHVTKSQYRCICSECVLLKILLHDRNIIYLSTPLIPKLFFLEFYCPRAFYGHAMCFIIVAEWYINCIVIVALKNSGLYGKSAPGFSYKFIFSVICIIETFFPFIFYTRLGSTLFHSHILIQKALHSVFDLATWSAGENIARNIFINGVMFFCC